MKRLGGLVTALRSGEGLKGQLLRGGLGSIAIKIASTGLNLLLAIILARLLGAEGFGIYSYIFAIVTILAIPAQIGLPNLVVRETAKAQVTSDLALMKGLWRWATLMVLTISGVLVALGGLTTRFLGDRLNHLQLETFWWAMVLIPLTALGNVRGSALRGLQHVVLGQLPEFVLRPFLFISLAIISAWLFQHSNFNSASAMMAHVFSSAITFFVGLLLITRMYPEILKFNSVRYDGERWFKDAFILGSSESINIININIGIVLVGFFLSEKDAGALRIAYQTANFSIFPMVALESALAPYFARLMHENESSKISTISSIHSLVSSILSLSIFLLFIIFGEWMFGILYGSEFSSASLLTAIIMFGRFVQSCFASSNILMVMSGKSIDLIRVSFAGLMANMCFTISLIGIIGVPAAAVGSCVSYVLFGLLQYRYCLKTTGVNTAIKLGRGL